MDSGRIGATTPAFRVSLAEASLEEQRVGGEEAGTLKISDRLTQPSIEEWPSPVAEQIRGNHQTIYNMRTVRERLLEAFKQFDESTASMLMASMLSIYPVEQVCTELIVPTMWQIGEMWEKATVTVSVEHYASGFFRGLLSNLLHVTPYANSGPLVIVCCAPGEPHELAPLMLALFLRRAGIRVAYLGQSIETAGLLQTIKHMAPALVCVSLTLPAYLVMLIDLARQVEQMPAPHPLFAFGGQVFVHYTHLIAQVPGIYLGGNLMKGTSQVQRMLAERQI